MPHSMQPNLLYKLFSATLIWMSVLSAQAQPLSNVDFDNSGTVDSTDFILFSEAFGLDAPEGSFGAGFDIDGDGRVFFNDLFLLADNWGHSAGDTVANPKQQGPFENAEAVLLLSPTSVFDIGAGETLEFTLSGTGLVSVQQADFTFELDPPEAFVFTSSRFTRDSDVLESSLLSRDDDGTVRVGGFNSQAAIDGAATFGIFSIRLADDFSGRAAIHLLSAAMGPSSDRHDTFAKEQLDLSLAINPNTPPQLATSIADLRLSANLVPYIRDLEAEPPVFSDTDGDLLTYQTTSSDPGVARTSLVGSTLTVEALGPGSATLTLEADDGSGNSASVSFLVVVDAVVPFSIAYIDSDSLPLIDAELDEWQDLFGDPVLSSADFSSTTGEILGPVPTSDQDIEVWLGWNDETNLLYLAARVRDDAYGTTSFDGAVHAWRSDNIELYLDADNSGGFYSWDNLQAQEYVLNPEGKWGAVLFPLVQRDEAQQTATAPPLVQAAVRRQGNEYFYEMAVPGWNQLSVDGSGQRHVFRAEDVVGLTLLFADFEAQVQADARQHHAHNGLRGPVGAFRDADQFSDFRLAAPANEAPQVSTLPEPLFLTLDDGPITLDLKTIFSDPDADTLTFSVLSANPTVVSAEIVSVGEVDDKPPSLLRLTLLDTGGTLISLIADDGRATVQTAFTVDVAAKNNPPTVQTPPPDIQQIAGGDERVLDLNKIFTDADGDSLIFTSRISATGRIGIRLSSDGTLTLTPLAAGDVTVTLTADDRQATEQVAFTVTVEKANNPPAVQTATTDIQLVADRDLQLFDLNEIFADGDALAFNATSSDESVVEALVVLSGDADAPATLTLNPKAVGTAAITLSATDGQDTAATHFAVAVLPAVVSDLDGNGRIELADLFAFTAIYGSDGQTGGDADGDGRVDNTDFFILTENLGRSNAEFEVPDPAAPPTNFSGANADASFRLVALEAAGKATQVGAGETSDAVSIDKVASGQELVFAIQAEGISQVNQVEIVLQLSPPQAFDLSSVAFTENEGLNFSPGILVSATGLVEMAAANLALDANDPTPLAGDQTLGTVRLKTTDFFAAGFHADIRVQRLALGPRLVEQDIFVQDQFTEDQLDLNLRLNNSAPAVIFFAEVDITVKGENFELPLGQIIQDPNGDALEYRVSLSEPSLARADIVVSENSVTEGPLGLTLRVTPLEAGTGTIVIEAQDPWGAQTTARIPLTVQPAPAPIIEISATEINFDQVIVGQTATRLLTVANSGNAALNVSSVSGAAPPFRRLDTPFVLEPESEIELSIGFVPTSGTVFRDTLVLSSDDPLRPRLEVVLLGTGGIDGALAATALDFGTVEVGQSRIDTLLLFNQKNVDFPFITLAFEAVDTETFSLPEPLETNGVLAAGDVLPVQVRFAPNTDGTAQAILRWIGADDSLRVSVSGTGIAARLESAATELNFGDVALGQQKTLDLLLTNRGDAPLVLEAITSDLKAFSPATNSARIAPGEDLSLELSFVPEQSGAHSGRLTLRSNDITGAETIVLLKGNGTEPPPDPPAAPALLQPVDGAGDQALSLQFLWGTVTGTQTYEIQIDNNSDFASALLEQDALGDTSLVFADLEATTTYLWRVRGHNASGPGEWSPVWTFTTAAPALRPAVPVPQTPVDGTEIATLTPALTWFKVEGAQTYRLQVAQNNRFAGDDLVEDFADIADTTFALLAGLEDGGTYQWRVWAANNAGASSWSTPQSFTVTLPTTSPGVPQPDTPDDEATVGTDEPILHWFGAKGVQSYRIQVTTIRNNFGRLGVIEDFEPVTDTLYTLKGLENGRSYWWRLYAQNEAGVSAWSNPRGFTVILPATLPKTPSPDQPTAGSGISSNTVELSWNQAEGALSYIVEVATDDAFSAVFVRREDLSATTVQIENLTDGQTYFWRVQAINEAGTSDWSAARSFSVVLPLRAPAIPVPATPTDGFAVDTLTPTLRWFAVTEAQSYRVQVGQNSRFVGDDLLEDVESLSDTSFTLLQGLIDGNTYQWRVWAANNAGNSSWSPPRTFLVQTPLFDETPPTFPDVVSAWTDDTRQSSLEDGAWHADPSPFFVWSGSRDEVSGVAGYAVALTQTASDTVVLDQTTDQAAYAPAAQLQADGTYHLLVRVVDAAGNWSDAISLFTYRFDATPPVLDTTPPFSQVEGRDLVLAATIDDVAGIAQAQVHYRTGGTAAFTTLDLQAENETYSATVPGRAIDARGLQYYLSAVDAAGNRALSPGGGPAAPVSVAIDVQEALALILSPPTNGGWSVYRFLPQTARLSICCAPWGRMTIPAGASSAILAGLTASSPARISALLRRDAPSGFSAVSPA
jgi:hypothetical protein